MEWRVCRILDIDDVALVDRETVDLEGVSGLERVLPAPLLQRDAVVLLRNQLGLIDMNVWMRKEQVRHHASGEKLLQLDAKAHHRNIRDRGMRMRLLNDLKAVQREKSANQL